MNEIKSGKELCDNFFDQLIERKDIESKVAILVFLVSDMDANVGTSGAQFLKLTPGARTASLGNAGSTFVGAESIYNNPAGLYSNVQNDLQLSHVSYLESVTHTSIVAVRKSGNSAFGLGINCLTVSEITKYDNT